MEDGLTERVEALERAVTGGDHDLSALADDADALDSLARLDEQVDDLETRTAELEAATQALRGYVGNVRAVNEEVETRAETALAKVEALEERGPQTEAEPETGQTSNGRSADTGFESSTPGAGRHTRTGRSGSEQPPGNESRPPRTGGKGVEQEMKDGTETHHCTSCGQVRPDSTCGPVDGAAGPTTEERMGAEPWDSDGTESLRQRDPLVSEAEDDPSTLDRFKQLL